MTEVSTRSVGLLKGVELGIVSMISHLPETRPVWIEEFHDQNAAMRSIDGREADWIKAAVLQHLQAQDEETVAKWSGAQVVAKLAKWEAETIERLAARAMSINYKGE